VLVTRPEPGAAETARQLAARGFEPVLAPALVLVNRKLDLPAAQALLLTSRAAARALPAIPEDLPVLAVGEATAAEARARGARDVIAAAGDAAALATLVATRLDPGAGPLLLAVGAGYGQDLAMALRARGFRVLRRLAYEALPAPEIPAPAREAIAAGRVVAALFFSPRSALCAISLLRTAGLEAMAGKMLALAISPRVGEAARRALSPLAWREIRIAQRPDQAALLELLGSQVT
jgi:uroporphyrinogen-III synthase